MFIVLGGTIIPVDNIRGIRKLNPGEAVSKNGKYHAEIIELTGTHWLTAQSSSAIEEALRCCRDPEYAHRQELKWALDRIKEAEEQVDNVLGSPSVKRLPAGAIKKLKEASQILNSKITVENRMAVGYIR